MRVLESENMDPDECKAAALKYAVLNASQHEGSARKGPVLSRLLAEFPGLRERAKELMPLVARVVEEVNSWPLERQKSMLLERWPELLEPREAEEEKKLPPLPNVERFKEVRTRFAPNPDGPLHLGSARPVILCHEYARIYGGKFILRFEDTSPEVKAPIPEMYDWITEDLMWLGAEPDEVYIQSDRLSIYYKNAEKLLAMGAAYVCTCTTSTFRKLYLAQKPCPCRDLPPKDHLDRWKKMLDGTYDKGEAVVRIKTDLHHPNPAVRDWPALRISTTIHPRTGDRYRVWPLYNFSCAIDDHEMAVSHIIRGKEHVVNTTRQRYVFEHLGWEYPEILSVGRLGLEAGILSKSRIRTGVEDGTYSGWDDPRLGTLRALRRRGTQPEAIRELMIQVGPKPVNATLSWGLIASVNRRIIEPLANRYFFVAAPVPLSVSGVDGEHVARLLLHPDHPERGTRDYTVKAEKGCASFVISRQDAEKMERGNIVRLMGLLNIEILKAEPGRVEARSYSKDYQEARAVEAPFIHWLQEEVGLEAEVIMPDASVEDGLAEPRCSALRVNEMIQFERFGFVRVDNTSPFVAYYAHN